ncbi:hypothetical protein [Micromonospora sp. NPDC023888]|uniref:hypothetical protein n=1 Tax=Micromonospora sp. NPDC023888 TaxID=3155607 RepID=UPI0034054500
MHAEAALWADPQRSGHEDVNVVGERGGVFDTVQVGGRRARDRHPRRQPEEGRATGQGVVPVQPSVGVDVVTQSHPGGAAELMFGEQTIPDSVGAAEDLPGQGVGAVRTWWHAEQLADHRSAAETPVDNLAHARRPPCGQPRARPAIVVWRGRVGRLISARPLRAR